MDNWKRVSTTSERLREALDKANMKQADLARATGLDKGSIHHYLTGKYEPKARSIKKMAAALSVDEMWLWGYDVSEKENTPKESSPAEPELNEGERALLDLFRKVPEDQQDHVLDLIRIALKIQK